MGDLEEQKLETGEDYALSAAPDRTCFTLRNNADGMVAALHGDDAARFRHDYDELKTQFPDWNADKLLAQLWDQGGYGWLAQKKE